MRFCGATNSISKTILLAAASRNIVLFPFTRVHKVCSISNFDQTIRKFSMDFSYIIEEIMNTKTCKI